MTDNKQRPDCFDFAMDFLGDPEASEILAYVEELESRAALSEREPEGPTDIELLSMAGTAIGHEIEFGEYEPETECAVEAYGSELIDFARAVLARWGRPS